MHAVSSDLKDHDDADRVPLPHTGDKTRDAVGVPLPLSLEVRQLDLADSDLLEQFAEGDIRAFERHGWSSLGSLELRDYPLWNSAVTARSASHPLSPTSYAHLRTPDFTQDTLRPEGDQDKSSSRAGDYDKPHKRCTTPDRAIGDERRSGPARDPPTPTGPLACVELTTSTRHPVALSYGRRVGMQTFPQSSRPRLRRSSDEPVRSPSNVDAASDTCPSCR